MKGKIELRLTEEEKILIKVMASMSGKRINEYIVELVKKDRESKKDCVIQDLEMKSSYEIKGK